MKSNFLFNLKKRCLFGFVATLMMITMSSTTQSQEIVLTQETELPEKYHTLINPFWDNQVQKGQFSGEQEVKIHTAWILHPQSKGSIVISSGRTEGSIKYKEVFYDLYQNGYSVFTLDHRGQGQSGRMAQNPDKGHVEDYSFFVADLQQFITEIVLPHSQSKPNLLCHSMGCAIGALYLISYPDTFQKVVFSSPMFGINAPIPQWLAQGILGTHRFFNTVFGSEPWYFPGQGDKQTEPFTGNGVTHSEVRYQQAEAVFEELGVALGGITGGWLKASMWAMNTVAEQAEKIKIPALLLQSGGDTIVANETQDVVCNSMPDCQLINIPNAKHELLMEQDQYRNPAMTHILQFFEE